MPHTAIPVNVEGDTGAYVQMHHLHHKQPATDPTLQLAMANSTLAKRPPGGFWWPTSQATAQNTPISDLPLPGGDAGLKLPASSHQAVKLF
eukprot:TRINITY_DN96068_c0_g1_i1.p1 TRINITY_DN96068_c0_g1~~TRINITY_DN96068_c0_g1_i1.p1  ORF type:complete len:100 (+),score=6.63 TRINITY_DN96068_c0_g1_i1:29-301(+)